MSTRTSGRFGASILIAPSNRSPPMPACSVTNVSTMDHMVTGRILICAYSWGAKDPYRKMAFRAPGTARTT